MSDLDELALLVGPGPAMSGRDALKVFGSLLGSIDDAEKEELCRCAFRRFHYEIQKSIAIKPTIIKAKFKKYRDYIKCGNCGHGLDIQYIYCPNCGRKIAKMITD